MIKLCIWMDVPSHYQKSFFNALVQREDVDLLVFYFKKNSENRAMQGWDMDQDALHYEHYLDGAEEPEEMLALVPDGLERIHLICSHFNKELILFFCQHNIKWCHWSEMPGIRLAELLGYRITLFRILNPLMLLCKHKEGRRIKKHALVAFGQGLLAGRAFRLMGVPRKKIFDLFYVPDPLSVMPPNEQIRSFAQGRRVFLTVGTLCKRKGIDILLKAFARLDLEGWCLVLCGLDKSNGKYRALSKSLGIDERVLFLGPHPVKRISEVYTAADVFVLVSRFDGWGAVLNEAASAGLPLIGADLCGASWHVIEEGKNGYRVKAGSPQALSVAMQSFTANPQKIEHFGRVSKKLYFSEFTPERNSQRLVDALQSKESKQNA